MDIPNIGNEILFDWPVQLFVKNFMTKEVDRKLLDVHGNSSYELEMQGLMHKEATMLSNGIEIYTIGDPGPNPDKYREGIKYFGIGPFRFGSNGEWNRHNIQNKCAHDSKVIDYRTVRTVPYFKFLTEVPTKRYFYFGTGGGLGTY